MGLAEFTARECDYFRAACNLMEIAMALHVSASTVDRRVRSVKRKIERVL